VDDAFGFDRWLWTDLAGRWLLSLYWSLASQHSAATRSVAASADGDPDREMARNLQAWTANTFYSLLDI
jgi:hypothetical protein